MIKRLLVLGIFAFAISMAALPAAATPPQQRITSLEARSPFVPTGGYGRNFQTLRVKRHKSARVQTGASPADQTLTREHRILVILVSFLNRFGAYPKDRYQYELFDRIGPEFAARPVRRTMTQYFFDMSRAKFLVSGTVVGWYELPKYDSYYEFGKNEPGPRFAELLTFALLKADADPDLNFGDFDNDGPDGWPNSGDDDGQVDFVAFIHPETGGECEPQPSTNFWSHSGHYNDRNLGLNEVFVTNDIELDLQGNPVIQDDGTPKRITINDYTIQPGIACTTGLPSQITDIGVFVHEFCHSLGLPDLYDRTPLDSIPDSVGIGGWGLMGFGSWGFSGVRPDHPTRMTAWPLTYLGWADVVKINKSGRIDFEPVQENNKIYRIDVPETNGNEYFLIEYSNPDWVSHTRRRRLNWNERVSHGGLAIWHIDESVGSEFNQWPFAPHDKGQNDTPSRPGSPSHSLVSLEQADCLQQLEKKESQGDIFDLYGTGQDFQQTESCLGAGPTPYDGRPANFKITSVNIADRHIFVEFLGDRESSSVVRTPATQFMGVGEGKVATPSAESVRADSKAAEIENVENPGNSIQPAPSKVHTLSQGKYDKIFSDKDLAAFMGASEHEIVTSGPPEKQKIVRAYLAKKRRILIRKDTQPNNKMEEALIKLRDSGVGDSEIEAQYDDSGTHFVHVTGLTLPPARNPRDKYATGQVLAPLIAVKFLSGDAEVAADSLGKARTLRYQQVYSTQGKRLPVYSKGVSIYYDEEGRLNGFTDRTISPSELKVIGEPGKLTYQQARTIATSELGLSAARSMKIQDKGEGIYLVDGDPWQGRAVRKLELPVSNRQKDNLVIYVDEATATVVEIK